MIIMIYHMFEYNMSKYMKVSVNNNRCIPSFSYCLFYLHLLVVVIIQITIILIIIVLAWEKITTGGLYIFTLQLAVMKGK